jgi:hypothetical protein
MDGSDLPPPLLPPAAPVPAPPPASPWSRPVDGQPPATYSVTNAPIPAESVRRHRSRKPFWLLGVVALVVAAVTLIAIRGGNDDTAPARGAQSEIDAGAGASAATLPGTVATSQPGPGPSTEPDATPPITTNDGPPPTVGPLDVEAGTYELAAITQAASGPQRFVTTSSFGGTKSTVTGEIDAAQRVHTRTVVDTDVQLEMILDVPAGIGYLHGFGIDDLITTTDAEWAAVDLEAFLAMSGQSLDGMRENLAGGLPPGIVDHDPVRLGLTEIDGESVMLYWVGLSGDDLAELLAGNPQFAEGGGPLAASGIDRAEYSMFVTSDSRLRRMQIEMTVQGSTLETVYDTLPIAPDFEVELPAPDSVQLIDLADLES